MDFGMIFMKFGIIYLDFMDFHGFRPKMELLEWDLGLISDNKILDSQ